MRNFGIWLIWKTTGWWPRLDKDSKVYMWVRPTQARG
jgi:hypothetical protein